MSNYNTASGSVPIRFLNDSRNFDGDKIAQVIPPSINTQMRLQAEQTLLSCPDLEKCITDCFRTHESECRAYVLAKGETPKSNIVRLAMQVVLLRALDISNVAKSLDISDEDALQDIESTEAGLQEINSPDMYSALSFPVQAAVKICLDKMSDLHSAQGGSGTMCDALYFLSGAGPAGSTAPLNNADGPVDTRNTDAYISPSGMQDHIGNFDLSDLTDNDVPNDAPYASPSMPGLAVQPIGDISAPPISLNSAGPISNAAPTSAQVQGSSNSGGILGALTGIFTSAAALANSVTAAANSSAGAVGAIKNAASNVGANSIAQFISNNKGTIIFVVIILVVLLYVIIHAAKNKHK